MFVVTESSTGPIERFREMNVAHVGVHGSGLPGSLLSGTRLWTLECLFLSNVGIHRAPKAIQVDGSRPRRRSWLRFPWLSPIRNSCELRVLYRRSYFGPRTCGGGITNFCEVSRALNQGFPFSPLNVHLCVQPPAHRCCILFTRGIDDFLGLREVEC